MIDLVDNAIQEIFSLSLAKRKNTSDTFWIHSMVHRWSHERLDKVKKEGNAVVLVSLTAAELSLIAPESSFGGVHESLHNLTLKKTPMPISRRAPVISAAMDI